MLFLQPSSCMNPFCLGCCLIFDRILWSIIAEYIFPSRDPMVIGLQFSTSFALFPGLGIIVIRVIFYCAGYIWCSMKRLHNFANAVPLSSWFSWFGPAAISALIFFNFSIRFPTVIRVQTSLISILLFKGYIVIYFYRPIWPKNFYRVELLSQSQRDWSLVCHYSAHPIMPSPITFVDIFCTVSDAWHIGISFFYCEWSFCCYSLFVFLVNSLPYFACHLLGNRRIFVEECLSSFSSVNISSFAMSSIFSFTSRRKFPSPRWLDNIYWRKGSFQLSFGAICWISPPPSFSVTDS